MARHLIQAQHKTVWASHQRVLNAASALYVAGHDVSVETLCVQTGMQRGTVNTCVRELQTEGLLKRIGVGLYRPVPQKPEPIKETHPAVITESFIRPLSLARLMGGKA